MDNYYNQHADRLFSEYRKFDPEKIHSAWVNYLPTEPGLACDIGAGSGRDADWLAKKGWDVIAVEPCKELRELANGICHPRVQLLDDALPSLDVLRKINHRFDLILLSAVWMHLTPKVRERAFRIITDMLAPAGIVVFTLRHGDEGSRNGRTFFPVGVDELNEFAKNRALSLAHRSKQSDVRKRDSISWETAVYRLPDDGTGGLPLLRHIIINDDKSSTYKLGLLRALIRIAEGAPGLVLNWSDDFVDIPFGLVGLYWLKLYMPLVLQNNIRQLPSQRDGSATGMGWAKDDFYSLDGVSPFDLRVGATFSQERANQVIGAIRAACDGIMKMPARYITLPGGSAAVFLCEKCSVRKTGRAIQINREFLSSFGVFRIPTYLWQSMGQYACWLEPAIVNEWKNLMLGWQVQYSSERYDAALQWEEGKRDTAKVRAIAKNIQEAGGKLQCVWTSTSLRKLSFEIDHCFPWSRWFNNDLWNLLPTTTTANGEKSDKLPSASLVASAEERVKAWWGMAYIGTAHEDQFFMEAEASLPGFSGSNSGVDDVFEGLKHQRLRLRKDQQLMEWFG